MSNSRLVMRALLAGSLTFSLGVACAPKKSGDPIPTLAGVPIAQTKGEKLTGNAEDVGSALVLGLEGNAAFGPHAFRIQADHELTPTPKETSLATATITPAPATAPPVDSSPTPAPSVSASATSSAPPGLNPTPTPTPQATGAGGTGTPAPGATPTSAPVVDTPTGNPTPPPDKQSGGDQQGGGSQAGAGGAPTPTPAPAPRVRGISDWTFTEIKFLPTAIQVHRAEEAPKGLVNGESEDASPGGGADVDTNWVDVPLMDGAAPAELVGLNTNASKQIFAQAKIPAGHYDRILLLGKDLSTGQDSASNTYAAKDKDGSPKGGVYKLGGPGVLLLKIGFDISTQQSATLHLKFDPHEAAKLDGSNVVLNPKAVVVRSTYKKL